MTKEGLKWGTLFVQPCSRPSKNQILQLWFCRKTMLLRHGAWRKLAKICQCMQDNSRIIPLFYDVEPFEVRHQKGKFGDAFTNLKKKSGRHTLEKVEQWRKDLEKVADYSGCNTKNHKDDTELIEAIVKFVCSKVRPTDYLKKKVRPLEFEFFISSREFELFGATSEAMDNVMKVLSNEEMTVVGVYGMGGIGKTTLVEHVGVQAQKKGLFREVTMAVISQEPDIWKIQDTLAEKFGEKLEGNTVNGRAYALRDIIASANRILVILEEIWKYIDLSKIGIPSVDQLKRCNSKVLLSTRRSNVLHLMRCQARIHLGTLNEADSLKLFLNAARSSFDESTQFLNVARDVASECAGLPVALIAVANALGDKDLV